MLMISLSIYQRRCGGLCFWLKRKGHPPGSPPSPLKTMAFHDALALRYGWTLSMIPSTCSCGSKFSVEHALSCAKGGFPSIRHNEIRNLTATLLTEVCHDVCIEPELQPVTGEVLSGATANSQDGARLDIAANGFWGAHLKGHTLMLGFLTLMPCLTDTLHYLPPTENTSR